MKKTISGILLIILCLFLFPTSTKGETITYFKTTGNINVRSGPGTKYKKVGLAQKNKTIKKIGTKNAWSKIKWNGKTRYIKSQYLKPFSKTLHIKYSAVHVRKQPTTNSKIITTLKKGKKVKVSGEKNGWYQVVLNNKKYFIRKDLLATASSMNSEKETGQPSETVEATAAKLIQAAKDRLGDQYSQSRRDEEGYADCSSLMRDIFKKVCGVYIGNNTVEQMAILKDYTKSFDNLKPGDLLMRKGDGSNHVGLYIGDGQYIHTSSVYGEVVISTYKRDYWTYCYDAIGYCNSKK